MVCLLLLLKIFCKYKIENKPIKITKLHTILFGDNKQGNFFTKSKQNQHSLFSCNFSEINLVCLQKRSETSVRNIVKATNYICNICP